LLNRFSSIPSIFWPVFFLIVAYSPVLFSSAVFSPDASIILPYLDGVTSLKNYWHDLLNLKTIDVQPVRDFSLWIDLLILKHSGLKSFIWQNLFIWILAVWIIGSILRQLFPQITAWKINAALILFALHPVFNTSINWSMGRKHLLALLFITLATNNFLRAKASNFKIVLFYLLGVFSQPIVILWPLWAVTYQWMNERKSLKQNWPLWSGLGLTFAGSTYWNFLYYQTSPVFQSIYDSKTAFAFEFSDKILALGHYSFTLLWPTPAFYYDLGHWSTLAGLVALGLFTYLCLGLRLDKKFLTSWSFFGLLPLFIVLNTPRLLSDTYLLIPALAVLILLVGLRERIAVHIPGWVVAFAVLVFVGINHIESRAWTDPLLFAERNYQRRPNCLSALSLARMKFSKEKLPSEDEKAFMQENSCLTPQTKYQILELMVLSANLVYYNSQESYPDKIATLQSYAPAHYYADLILIALHIKEQAFEDANQAILKLAQRLQGKVLGTNSYDPIVAKVVLPYCQSKGFISCENVAKTFAQPSHKFDL
jgi:hypothetical protein